MGSQTALAQTLRHLICLCLEVEECRRSGEFNAHPELDEILHRAERHAAEMIGANDWDLAVQWAKSTEER